MSLRTSTLHHYQQPGESHQYTSPGPPHCSLSSLVCILQFFLHPVAKVVFKTGKLPGPVPPYLYPVASQTLHLQTEFQGLSDLRRWSFSPVSSCPFHLIFIAYLLPVGSVRACICWASSCHHSDLNSLSPLREAFPMAPGTTSLLCSAHLFISTRALSHHLVLFPL